MVNRRVASTGRNRRRRAQGIVVYPRRGNLPRLARLSPEIKYQLVQIGAAIGPNAAGGSIFNCAIPGQGASATTRVGDKCRIIGVEVNMEFFLNFTGIVGAPNPDNNHVRMIVFWSPSQTLTNGSAATFEGDYFDPSTVSDLLIATKDLNTDIRTLHDGLYGVNDAGSLYARTAHMNKRWKCNVPLKFTPGTTVGLHGSVGVWMCSINAIGAGLPSVGVNCRGMFKFKFLDD